MTDLAARLAEALDRAEQLYEGGHFGGCALLLSGGPFGCDCRHRQFMARLIARDRALLTAYASAGRNLAEHVARCGPNLCGHRDYLTATTTLQILTTAVEAAARFWLPEEVTC
ncbi:hypothetical protein Drose_06320 [Dactylosporangium roseum]|uniref:Uncharacterized protein n=1 Tax=Dactylosporangium roseum TaxID=47989 RepID=A0ABY5ZAQ0_9ACTN|nr:hypothetical protein [Dactylosporangium roseum]UWZ37887.1 hypothetical protein Drose_06320 [Dactylosporangium roseum]